MPRTKISRTSDGMRLRSGFKRKRRGLRRRSGFKRRRFSRRKGTSFKAKLLRQLQPTLATYEAGVRGFSRPGQASYTILSMVRPVSDLYNLFTAALPTSINPMYKANGAEGTPNYYTKTFCRTELASASTAPLNIQLYTIVPKRNIRRTALQLNTGSNIPGSDADWVAQDFGVIGPNGMGIGTNTGYNSSATATGYGAGLFQGGRPGELARSPTGVAFFERSFQSIDSKYNADGADQLLWTLPIYTPFDSPRFMSSFKIIKATKPMCLNPGKCFTVTQKSGYQRYKFPDVDDPSGVTDATAYMCLKGQPIIVAKVWGTPSHDATGTNIYDLGQGQVSITRTVFNFAMSRKYWVKTLPSNAKTALVPFSRYVTTLPAASEAVMAAPIAGVVVASQNE